jgi:hypothetical protein
MSFIHYSQAKAVMDLRVDSAVQQAKIDLLQRQIEASRKGWLLRQSCRLLYQLGHRLVALGKRLERHGLPQTLPFEGRMSSSG